MHKPWVKPFAGIFYERERYMIPFCELWDSTLPAASVKTLGWNANPDVWVIEFDRTERRAESL